VEKNAEAMVIALRVLSAVTQGHTPDPTDVQALRRYEPRLDGAPVDELACEVIQQTVKRRLESRKASGAL